MTLVIRSVAVRPSETERAFQRAQLVRRIEAAQQKLPSEGAQSRAVRVELAVMRARLLALG